MNEELTQISIETTKILAESSKTRKRKLDPTRIWAKRQMCPETGNLENLIRQGIAIKNKCLFFTNRKISFKKVRNR